jgi:aspartokinase
LECFQHNADNKNMSDLLVMKFGGTSMGSASRIRVAAQISAEQHAKRPVVSVVSAMSKVTDLLLDSLRKAEAGDQADLDENVKQRATSIAAGNCCRRRARKRLWPGCTP